MGQNIQLLSIIYADYVPAAFQHCAGQILRRQHALQTVQPKESIESVAYQHALLVTTQDVNASGAEPLRIADDDWTIA